MVGTRVEVSGGPATCTRARSSNRYTGRRRPTGERRRAACARSRLDGEGSGREAPTQAASSRYHNVAAGCGQHSGRATANRGRGLVFFRIWGSFLGSGIYFI